MKIFKGQKNRKGALALALAGLTLALLFTLTSSAISYAAGKTKDLERSSGSFGGGSIVTNQIPNQVPNSTPNPASIGGVNPSSYTGYPTDNTSFLSHLKAVLHPGAGEQYVNGKIILDAGVDALPYTTYFDARNSGSTPRPSFFQASKNVAHSVLASLYDFTVVDGPLFIGLPLGAFQSQISGTEFDFDTINSNNNVVHLWTSTYGSRNPFSATLQKVNIAGAVRSSALSHQFTDPQRVCVNDKGILTLDCPSGTTQTYRCTGTLPANATLCSGDDQGLSQDTGITLVNSCTNTQKCEATCNTGYHEDNGTCVADAPYHWQTGNWSQCSQATQAYCDGQWTTQGTGACVGNGVSDNGYDYYNDTGCYGYCGPDDYTVCSDFNTEQSCNDFSNDSQTTGSCAWDTSIETHYCANSNPQSASECTQQNSACHWVDAQNSVRRRSVNCVDQNGTVVADSYCSGAKPSDAETCVNGQCPDPDSLLYNSSAYCIHGTVSDVRQRSCPSGGNGSNGSTWKCLGSNGGTNDSCITPTCFLPDTKVTMADGSLKNIQDVKIGEKVVGRNGEVSPVLGIHRPSVRQSAGGSKVYAFNGGRFFVTAEHPFLTTEGWKAINPVISKEKHPEISSIAHLKVGDTLITDHGKVVLHSITSKEVDPNTTVYNLILGGDHTYIADGYVVHNSKCRDGGVACNSENQCGAGQHCCSDGLCKSDCSMN